jgi:putative hemolysin
MAVPQIDVKRVLAEKNPRLLKWMPGFLLRYLKRIVHQEEINRILLENEDLRGAEFCSDIVKRWNLNIVVKNLSNLPEKGGVILASNHPLGGFDAIAMVHELKDYRPDLKFIVNDILMNLENLSDLFVGVNKHGSNAASKLKSVNEAFASDTAVCVFPAGLVSRKDNGIVRDLEWKKTFASQAIKNKKQVVPVFIDGTLSNFFYRLYAFRKFIGIKANIEMLYLVHELFKQKNKTIRITFGRPMNADPDATQKDAKAWANEIRRTVYNLGNEQ